MTRGYVVQPNRYYDSVFLMRVAKVIGEEPGIEDAIAVMATDANRQALASLGYGDSAAQGAGSADLVIAVSGTAEAVRGVESKGDGWLALETGATAPTVRSIEEGLAELVGANIAAISVPGPQAAAVAQQALDHDLNVFLFSDNVSLADEIALKERAAEKGLIVMGPDCGTAIIHGIGLGFANVVRQGDVGVTGPSGTGLQEFTTLVHRLGSGISHAIGTGSRDLSNEVGARSTLQALDLLEDDPGTRVIAVVGKPPGEKALALLERRLEEATKPAVICLLGMDRPKSSTRSVQWASTIDQAVKIAVGTAPADFARSPTGDGKELAAVCTREQRFLRGLFAGGTLGYQAQYVLGKAGIAVHSNAPLPGMKRLSDPTESVEHSVVDMGDDSFTRGRPHPMIDAGPRADRIVREAHDPEVAALLFDVVLGYAASENPAGDLVEALGEARRVADRRGAPLCLIASVCGTEQDPQILSAQEKILRDAGVLVFETAACAADFARDLVLALEARDEGV